MTPPQNNNRHMASNTEQSYIDIYRQNAGTISAQSAGPLNAHRQAAFEAFCERGFPTARWEDFQRSDLRKIYAADYGINLRQFDITFDPYDAFKCEVQTIKSYLFFVVNDVFYTQSRKAQDGLEALRRQGAIVGSLREVARTHPDMVAKYYGQAARYDKDTTVAFNTAFAQDGFCLCLPAGVTLDAPVQIINVMNADLDLMATSRNLIVAERGSQLQLLVCAHATKSYHYLANRVTEVFAQEGSQVEIYKLEDTSEQMTNIGSLFVRQERDASVLVNEITLKNGFTRNNVDVQLVGEGASLDLCGIAIADRTGHIDNHTFVNHAVPHCTTNELYKYVLNDSATGSFDGKIWVGKGAQKTEAYQTNRNIVVTPTAKMYTKPHLEIYADDVKCSHGCTVGQLDQSALFYMRSRGIPEAEARMLLMVAFASDVIDKIKIGSLRTRMHRLVELRFRDKNYKCNTCGAVI